MALNTIPNAGLTKRGFPTARVANPFIINGGFEISQRAGTTATSFVNNTYGLDRWKNYLNGSCALNYQQLGQASSIVTNLQSTSGINYTNCLYLDCTTAASLGSTDLVSVLQLMEGYVHNPLAGKAMTLSFWVRSSVTGTYCVAFKEGSTKTYVVEYTISSADTWEQKIISITNDTLANYNTNTSVTNSSSLQVNFTLRLGTSSQQTSAGAWNSGNFYGTSDQVTWGTSTSHDFYLAGVQLNVGEFNSTTLPAFEFESYGDNLARCQRYYFRTPVLQNQVFGTGFSSNSTTGRGLFENYQVMRSAPTMSKSSNTDFAVHQAASSTDTTALAFYYMTNKTSLWYATVSSGLTEGNGALLIDDTGASAYIEGSAEL